MTRITVTSIIASLLAVQCCFCVGSTLEKAKAGENFSFSFHFQTFNKDCLHQLKYNNIIFQDNGTNIESETYPTEKHNRSSVRLEIRQPEGVIVHLNIRQLQPSDAGLYVCSLQCLHHTARQEYIFNVFYPAGPASCLWIEDSGSVLHAHYIHGHFMLKCIAQIGNPQGTIICIQLDEPGPVTHLPHISSFSEGIITTSFWFKKEVPVQCCSVSQIYQKHFENCLDFRSELTNNPRISSETSTRTRPTTTIRGASTIETESVQTFIENAESGTKSFGQGIICRIICLVLFIMNTRYLLSFTQ